MAAASPAEEEGGMVRKEKVEPVVGQFWAHTAGRRSPFTGVVVKAVPGRLHLREVRAAKNGTAGVTLGIRTLHKEWEMVHPGPITEGCLVGRGPDWKWGDQDCDARGRVRDGQVALPITDDGWVYVLWSGDEHKQSYRYGFENAWDVVPLETLIPR